MQKEIVQKRVLCKISFSKVLDKESRKLRLSKLNYSFVSHQTGNDQISSFNAFGCEAFRLSAL